MNAITSFLAALALLVQAGMAQAQATEARKTLTLEGAKTVAAAAAAEATKGNEGASIAVVDDGGNLIGKVTLLTKELSGPNGIAFSPDERYLYVDNWDLKRRVLMRYEVNADGTIANGKVFYDFTRDPEPVALDGIKVDQKGNVYVSAPGGVWIISAEGKALGRMVPPEHDANFAFGDADGKSMYMTASTGLYRIRVSVPGIRPPLSVESASK